ncbi:preprotein translocase subunit SecY [Candidatus Kapabacteria bacterium]|nr:preprotein translocase subunit SecY [Candidatus Kapabacteria bacterium]
MANFFQTIGNIGKIEELKKKIFYTIGMLLIVRIGAYITLPGIDVEILQQAIANNESNSLFGFFNTFVGGAFFNAAIFALGIMPYITASIIFQLAGIVIPEIQKMQKEGEDGRRKINQYTRYAAVGISMLQAIGFTINLVNGPNGVAVMDSGFLFYASSVMLLTSGTILLMWIGEQITEKGIGNGISLIIFIGIIAQLPTALINEFNLVFEGIRHWMLEIVIFGLLALIIAAVILITQGARKIPVQYAKRQVGRKVYGGTTQHIPLRVNTAGVMPIIFAQALMFIPQTLHSILQLEATEWLASLFDYNSYSYALIFALLVILFTFFYTAIVFNPKEIADNMKRNGGFIPGVRPGKPTAQYIESVLTRITLPGSVFLAIIAILPVFLTNIFGVTGTFSQFFGGTSLLIIVGVALDTLQQIESHLIMRHYDGFMKTGKMRGRVSQ